MKHAYLIMAHRDEPLLKILIELLDDSRIDIFLHIDSKSKIDAKKYTCEKSKLYVIPSRSVTWAGESQILTELDLIKYAVCHDTYEYYHLLSGSDLPIKALDYIFEFFEKNKGFQFVELWKPIYRRNQRNRYYSQHDCNYKNPYYSEMVEKSLHDQIKNNSFRSMPENYKLFAGSNWFSITHSAVLCILKHESEIIKYFCNGHYSDEVFIQTILMNNGFDKQIKGGLRYIKRSKGTSPDIITSKNLNEIQNTNCLFARKFDSNKDGTCILKVRDIVKNNIIFSSDHLNYLSIDIYDKFLQGDSGYFIIASYCPIPKTSEETKITFEQYLHFESPFLTIVRKNQNGIETIYSEKGAQHYKNDCISIELKPYLGIKSIGQVSLKIRDKSYYLNNNRGINTFYVRDNTLIDYSCIDPYNLNTQYRPYCNTIHANDPTPINRDEELIHLIKQHRDSPDKYVKMLVGLIQRKINVKYAINKLEKYSEMCIPCAQHALANYYLSIKDFKKGSKLLLLSAPYHLESALQYGKRCIYSNIPIEPIISILKNKADEGSTESAYTLSLIYYKKLKNNEEAYYWANYAVSYSLECMQIPYISLLFKIMHTQNKNYEIIKKSREYLFKGVMSTRYYKNNPIDLINNKSWETFAYYDAIICQCLKSYSKDIGKILCKFIHTIYTCGDMTSARYLGMFFEKNNLYITAKKWYDIAIDMGDDESTAHLLKMAISKQSNLSISALMKSYNLSSANCQYILAKYYLKNGNGDLAQMHMRVAANKDKTYLVDLIEVLMKSNDLSCEKEAFNLASKLSEENYSNPLCEMVNFSHTKLPQLGNKRAMKMLSIMYRDGIGTKKDVTLYNYWKNKI